uniref:APC n=1 Tax=Dendrocoelum lacteum TaxID=27895 RepID=T1DBP6_9PLAT
MSFNAYKKDYYASPRHLSILRESPEDMFLSGERSEDVYVNFDDRSIINNACVSFVKPLPARPNKPPPPLPNAMPISIEPVHPPVPIRISSNPVTMVTASTQTNRGTCIDGNVPDILAFTVTPQENNIGISGSPTNQYDCSFGFQTNNDCMGKSDIIYPSDLISDVDIVKYIKKFIDLMHDSLSWSVDKSGNSNVIKGTSTLDISRFEMRRNVEKEFYQVLKEIIDASVLEYYIRVYSAIQQIRNYCETLRVIAQYHNLTELNNYLDYEPGEATCDLMKMSFNENYRRIICCLGGLEALSQLIVINHSVLGDMANNYHLTLRRYTCMALTNLTFGISENKSFLCSIEPVILTIVEFLSSCSEEVKQVAASVIRNLSWKADDSIKLRLKEANISKILTKESMKCAKESCLKSILSALWNISAHCKENKVDICEVPGALAYFIDILSFKTIALVESSGGILRNISNVIGSSETYRAILRQNNAFQILLKHLRSSSLTVVGNACGMLCNLSCDCETDQQLLWDLGAVAMLKNLVHSKHRTISIGSASTLKNLLSARASLNIGEHVLMNALKSNSTSSSNTPDSSPRVLSPAPSLHVRKLNALESEIENVLRNNQSTSSDSKCVNDTYFLESHLYRQALSNCMNVSNHNDSSQLTSFSNNLTNIKRSDSEDSIISAHSDLTYDKVNFQSLNSKLKLCGSSKQTTSNNFMSLSGYANSNGHYDLTIEDCMKISNLSMDNAGSNTANNNGNPSNNFKKRNFQSYPEDYDSDSSEKPLDYSREFGDTDEYMTYPAPIISKQNQINPQGNIFRNIINIPPPTIKEKPKVYATEGTPIQCASRMSPLSEELEEDDSMNIPSNQYNPMKVINENSRGFTMPKDSDVKKKEEKPNSEIGENFPVIFGLNDNGKSNKCVKFESEPPHIIQDTPLMFSRSSSVESLDSFETTSFHSSVLSEYSRRTSGAVSPSDLPGSPGSDISQRSEQKSAQISKSKSSNSMSYSSSLSIDDYISIGSSVNSTEILQECIESGMPLPFETNDSNKMGQVINRFIDEMETAVCFAVEDTPYNYSTKASSLSDISISDLLNKENIAAELDKSSYSSSDTEERSELLIEVIQSVLPKGINVKMQSCGNYTQAEKPNMANNCSTFVALSNSEFSESYPIIAPHKKFKSKIDNNVEVDMPKLPQFFYCDIDSPRQYGVEGTPNSLSQRDSICSEKNLLVKMASESLPLKSSQIPPKPPKRTTSTLSSVPERTSFMHANEETSNEEELHVYMTEDTPANYSRASPISHSLLDTQSFDEIDDKIVKEDTSSPDSCSNQESKSINDDKSSLSSLSIESAGLERTLLQQCISSAMPTPKLKQPTVYGRRNHSSDHIIGSRSKCQLKAEISTNDLEKNDVKNHSEKQIDSSTSLITHDSRKKVKSISKLKKKTDLKTELCDVKLDSESELIAIPKSKLPEPKVLVKSSIPTHKNSKSANASLASSKPSSEKSVKSYPKSKSSCSLKSVLRYNSCVSSPKQNNKQLVTTVNQNDEEKDVKAKSDKRNNFHFLVNGFDASPNGLAASKTNITVASPSPKTDESICSFISIDNKTYSIDDKAQIYNLPKKDSDLASDSDTLELVEITGFLDDDFLKDESSSLEIDAARYRNTTMHDSCSLTHDTDDEVTDNDFNDCLSEKKVVKDNVMEDLIKDGVEAILSSLNSQFCNEEEGNFTDDFMNVGGVKDKDCLLSDMDVISASSTSSNNINKSKGTLRIVKPTVYNTSSDNDRVVSQNSIGIRGGRKSLIGKKVTKCNVVNAKSSQSPVSTIRSTTNQPKYSKVSNKITVMKTKGINDRAKCETSERSLKSNVTPQINSASVVNSLATNKRSGLPKFQNKNNFSISNSKIPGLSSSNIMLRTKTDKISAEEKKRTRSSTELSLLNNRNISESNLNGSVDDDDDDDSEGVWIVRNEICPQTVCIK